MLIRQYTDRLNRTDASLWSVKEVVEYLMKTDEEVCFSDYATQHIDRMIKSGASAIACDERCIKENPKYMNKVVAPTLDAVRSCSGFHTLPDYSFDTMPDDYAALVLIGGFGWLDEKEADKVVPIVRRAIEKGIIVGAICNAASFLAKHGFLNSVRHTGNGLEQLQLWGGSHYTNAARYVNAQVVSDHRIVTANGSGYLDFAKELLLLLENDTPEHTELFYQFNKLGFVEMMRRMQANK